MNDTVSRLAQLIPELSPAARGELARLGALDPSGQVLPAAPPPDRPAGLAALAASTIQAPSVLNEAYDYAKPSSFSRGLRIPVGDYSLLLISGTASIDDEGRTVHVGDFAAQCWRTYRNIATLLDAEGATWHDIVRTTCYLRDIERDYDEFNAIRTSFFEWLGIDPLPASVGIQMRLCRDDLLIEIEAVALLRA
jgi:2-iminobutanoate/2-iminopropanoate deaminase